MPTRCTLRVGLLLDSFVVSNWVYEAVRGMLEADYAEVVLVVLNAKAPRVDHQTSLPKRLWQERRHLLSKGFEWLDRQRTTIEPDAFELKNLQPLLDDIPVVRVEPRQTKYSDYIEGEDLQKIESYSLDVAVRFGFRILRGQMLKLPRFGIWSFHHGDSRVNRGGPPGFWEVLNGEPTTGVTLQVLTEDLDNGIVLGRHQSLTHPSSIHRNRNTCYWGGLSLLQEAMQRLHTERHLDFAEAPEPVAFYNHPLYRNPSNSTFAVKAAGWAYRTFKRKAVQAALPQQWIMLYALNGGSFGSLWRYEEIIPPGDRFWADPFPIESDGSYWIFCEEYLYEAKKGHIACCRLNSKGEVSPVTRVLERPYHLSYPFVFEHAGELFMIPETLSNRTVELYRCINFPERWELERVLMQDVRVVDATVVQHEGRWWLFAGQAENAGDSPWEKLFIYHAADPVSGDWTPHSGNPVVRDVRRARPAGRPFRQSGRLYRPGQYSRKRYGYGISINEVLTLSPERYEEKEVARIEPKWDERMTRVHTFNRCGNLTVIDAARRRPRWTAWKAT